MSLTKPIGHEESELVVSVSGGKDSTAMLLKCLEAGFRVHAVFADTGWEHPLTYEYLDYLQLKTGVQIHRVGVDGGILAKIRDRAGFPARMQRWCTRELKVEPIKAFHEKIAHEHQTDTISVVGIRAEESEARSQMAEFEWCPSWQGYVWRPMLNMTVTGVLNIHNAYGVKVNPLYQLGFSRVGCFPCIYQTKEEIRLLAENFPERIALIRQLENEITELRAKRNQETPGRYKWPEATFFQAKEKDDQGNWAPMPIDKVVAWSKTTRGGRQLPLIQEQPEGGCFRWGLCDGKAHE